MKRTFHQYLKRIIGFVVIFGIILFTHFHQTNYMLILPGRTADISDYLTILRRDTSNSDTFYIDGVYLLKDVNSLEYLIAWLGNTVSAVELASYYQHIDEDELILTSMITKEDSVNTAYIAAVNKASFNVNYETYYIISATYDYLTPNSLENGDIILTVNGYVVNDHVLSTVRCGNNTEFRIIRDGNPLSVYAKKALQDDGRCMYGFILQRFNNVVSGQVQYLFSPEKINGGGRSGGLIEALYIYFEIVDVSIEPNLNISGTGVIDVNGDVTEISGVKQKIITAVNNDIDIFFIPHLSDDENDNYIEALKVLKTLDSEMILVGVSTLDEAVDFLINYQRGDGNE